MFKLTNLEYGNLMQAINNAKNEIAEGTFIDPYNNEEGITDDQAMESLISAEKKLITQFTK